MLTLFDAIVYEASGCRYREEYRDTETMWYKSRFRGSDWRGPFRCSIEDWEDFIRYPNTRIAKDDLQT